MKNLNWLVWSCFIVFRFRLPLKFGWFHALGSWKFSTQWYFMHLYSGSIFFFNLVYFFLWFLRWRTCYTACPYWHLPILSSFYWVADEFGTKYSLIGSHYDLYSLLHFIICIYHCLNRLTTHQIRTSLKHSYKCSCSVLLNVHQSPWSASADFITLALEKSLSILELLVQFNTLKGRRLKSFSHMK